MGVCCIRGVGKVDVEPVPSVIVRCVAAQDVVEVIVYVEALQGVVVGGVVGEGVVVCVR